MADVVGKVFPAHNSKFEFGTNGLGSTDEQMVIPTDLENLASSTGGTTEERFAMDAAEWAKAAITGKKLSSSLKGKWPVGDLGNDYIAGLAWKFGQGVMTRFKWIMVSGATLACDVAVNVTMPGGGDTTNIDGLEFEMAGYGKPTFAPAAPAA